MTENVVGYLGEVHPEVADIYGIGERAYVAVLDMPEIIPYATFDRKYTGIAKYPAVTRDISMVVPKGDSCWTDRRCDREKRAALI